MYKNNLICVLKSNVFEKVLLLYIVYLNVEDFQR